MNLLFNHSTQILKKKAISYKVMMKHVLAKPDIGNNLRRCIILRNNLFFSSNISKHFDISF